jgi:hypothetical protein
MSLTLSVKAPGTASLLNLGILNSTRSQARSRQCWKKVRAAMGQLFPKLALLSAHVFMVNAIKSVNRNHRVGVSAAAVWGHRHLRREELLPLPLGVVFERLGSFAEMWIFNLILGLSLLYEAEESHGQAWLGPSRPAP